MPTVLRSRLPLLALAACALACLAAGASGDAAGAHAARVRIVAAPKRHPRARHRHRHRHHRPLGERAARMALRAVGVPYRWGGTSPSSGFDCSGLVYWAYGRLGIHLPHSSYALAGLGRRVPRSRLRPGDLLFFFGYGHVGVYIGHGRMVHAPHAGRRVEIVRLRSSAYGSALDSARRLTGA